MTQPLPDGFAGWLDALEARHLGDLRIAEVTRALRALSATYVERRRSGSASALQQKTCGALDTSGKRAAFALFYGPLHFLTVHEIVRQLGAHTPPPLAIADVGCGTGAAGAAWATASGGVPVIGVDRHPWALSEARWTYRRLGLSGRTRHGDATEVPPMKPGSAVVAAYVLNELADDRRERLERRLLDAAAGGVRFLVVEPIARAVAPWWDDTARRVERAGGRADVWRLALPLPPFLRLLDKAAGLDHHVVTARSLYCPGRPRE
jgi:hypothetical protein